MERLKDFCLSYLKGTNGCMHVTEVEKNQMTFQVLKVVQFMIKHGFY